MTWDLTAYFPTFHGTEMLRFKEDLRNDVVALQRAAASLPQLHAESAPDWEAILLRHEEIMRRMSHLSSYVGCLASSDACNEAYLKEEAELTRTRAEIAKIRIEFLRAIKKANRDSFKALTSRAALQGAQNYLNRLREEARRAMSSDKEVLATDLGVDGMQAWGRLYDTVSSKLEFDMVFPDGTRKRLPMSQRRSLLENGDRRVRKAAFDAGNEAWHGIEDTAAAAINAIAGTRLTLNRHRGVDHFLDIALFQAAITRKTLHAMFEALMANLELPRRILTLKANLLDRPTLAWFDLGAPLDLPGEEALSWDSAKSMVGESFACAYPELGNFFKHHVLAKNWIDWEPRPGKRPGGFCTSSMLNKESRIFMTYNQSLGDVLTLAHESGHAYHGFLVRDLRPYARGYPMTLAETASTFGEQVLMNGLLENPDISDRKKALLLDVEIGHGAIYLLDIPVRYEFEKRFYEERASGPLSVSRLKELMIETQRRMLGAVLENGAEDPYFWASKLHFYITGLTFYNFPYTFGYLLSRGLYAMFKSDGAKFLPEYEELLRLAGSDTAEHVVQRTIGKNIENPEFWADAIKTLEEPLERLQNILPKVIHGDNRKAQ